MILVLVVPVPVAGVGGDECSTSTAIIPSMEGILSAACRLSHLAQRGPRAPVPRQRGSGAYWVQAAGIPCAMWCRQAGAGARCARLPCFMGEGLGWNHRSVQETWRDGRQCAGRGCPWCAHTREEQGASPAMAHWTQLRQAGLGPKAPTTHYPQAASRTQTIDTSPLLCQGIREPRTQGKRARGRSGRG